MIERKNWS